MAYAFWLPTPYTLRFHMRTRHVLYVQFYLLIASAALMLSSCACNLVLCLVFREYISSFGLCWAASSVNVCLHLFVCVWEYCEFLDLYLSSENHHPLVFLLARTSKKYTTQEQDSVFIVPIWWTTRISKLFRNTAANFLQRKNGFEICFKNQDLLVSFVFSLKTVIFFTLLLIT